MAIDSANAILAYAKAQQRDITAGNGIETPEAGAGGFGAMVKEAMESGIQTAKAGEAAAAAGLSGEAALIDVVSAISAAEVTVQSVVAVRDRVISAYQEIMRMPI